MGVGGDTAACGERTFCISTELLSAGSTVRGLNLSPTALAKVSRVCVHGKELDQDTHG